MSEKPYKPDLFPNGPAPVFQGEVPTTQPRGNEGWVPVELISPDRGGRYVMERHASGVKRGEDEMYHYRQPQLRPNTLRPAPVRPTVPAFDAPVQFFGPDGSSQPKTADDKAQEHRQAPQDISDDEVFFEGFKERATPSSAATPGTQQAPAKPPLQPPPGGVGGAAAEAASQFGPVPGDNEGYDPNHTTLP